MVVLGRIIGLINKEFLALLKDPRSRTVVIVPPIVQTIIFGYAATYDLTYVPFAVFDESQSELSRHLVAEFEGSPPFHRIATLTHDGQIAPLIDAEDALIVLRIGPEFEIDWAAGRDAKVQILVDGRNSNTAQIALNYATNIVAQQTAEARGSPPPIRLVDRAWFNPNLDSQWFIVPGIVGILSFLVTLLVTSLSVAREREHGTFDQLLVTPLRPVHILIGKAVPGLLIGLGEVTYIVLVTIYWFEVPFRGNMLGLYAGLTVFILAAVGLGLMISSLSATMQQALLGTFLLMVPAIILSGFATPIDSMPVPVQWMTIINPLRYALTVVRSMFLEGMAIGALWHQLWPMAVIALVNLVGATYLFRHRMY